MTIEIVFASKYFVTLTGADLEFQRAGEPLGVRALFQGLRALKYIMSKKVEISDSIIIINIYVY